MRQIWLDSDPGFDDWMAWALLEADPGVMMHGVSIVAGNAALPRVLSNARRIAALHGWTTPIHAGCARPLVHPAVTAEDVLGLGGMTTTGAALPAAQAPLAAADGVDALIDCVRRHPGRITLLAIGPLTNVATAFARAPDLPGLLADLVIMGGSQGAGNTTPVAEFNVYADPEAAAQVFAQARHARMFGIEVCRQVQVGDREVEALRALNDPRARVFADHLDGYVNIARRRGRSTGALYDPTPVAWLAHPQWFELRPARVDVELHGRFTRGMTVCEMRIPQRAQPNADVAVHADGTRVLDWAIDLLRPHLVRGAP
jgi:purine nucleosidase